MMFLLLAQTAPAPLTGGEAFPYLSLIIQGGSFGVLGYLLIWGLPRMRKEIAEEHRKDMGDAAIALKEQRTEFTATLKEERETREKLTQYFRAENMAERGNCDKHFQTLADAMAKGNETTVDAVRAMIEQSQLHNMRNQQFTESLKQDIAALAAAKKEHA